VPPQPRPKTPMTPPRPQGQGPDPRPYRVGFRPFWGRFRAPFRALLDPPGRVGLGLVLPGFWASGPETRPCWALIGLFCGSWPVLVGPVFSCFRFPLGVLGPLLGPFGPQNRSFRLYSKVLLGPLFGPYFGLFSARFRRFRAFGPKGPKYGSHRALALGLLAGFWAFSAGFRSFSAFFVSPGPSGRNLTDWLPGRGPGFPGFLGFGPFLGPFGGPPAPNSPFRLYSKVFLRPPAHILAFSRCPVLGPQNTPSRGMLGALWAPNVPLWPWSVGPLRGPTEVAVPWLTSGLRAPNVPLLAPFGPRRGPKGPKPENPRPCESHFSGGFAAREMALTGPRILGFWPPGPKRPKRAENRPEPPFSYISLPLFRPISALFAGPPKSLFSRGKPARARAPNWFSLSRRSRGYRYLYLVQFSTLARRARGAKYL